jgi:hypothetical protein
VQINNIIASEVNSIFTPLNPIVLYHFVPPGLVEKIYLILDYFSSKKLRFTLYVLQ